MNDSLPELASTRDAARMYGCTEDHLLYVMKLHGSAPKHRVKTGGRTRYYWSPDQVMRTRAEERLRRITRDTPKPKPPRNYKRIRALAQVTMNERFRQKVLARIAARQL